VDASDFDLGDRWSPLTSGIEALIVSTWSRSRIHMPTTLGGMPAVIANFHPRELWLSIDEPVANWRRSLRKPSERE